MDAPQYFFYLLKPISPPKDGTSLVEYMSTLSEDQNRIVLEHFAFMEKLKSENKILIGGPLLDAKGLVLIIQVQSLEEANQIISKEPTIVGKLFEVSESHPLQIAVSSNNFTI